MLPTYRKKLIEVVLPPKAIDATLAREKSILHGSSSALHFSEDAGVEAEASRPEEA